MTLAEEAQHYLAVVAVFRAEGCEPHWRPEPTPMAPKPPAGASDDRSPSFKQRRTTR